MTRRAKRHPVLKATIWFCLVMLPSWLVLVLSGCSFEPSSLKGKGVPLLQHAELADVDGGK